MPANNYILESDSDLLYDPARYTGIDQVVVDNDNDTIGLSASFITTVNNKLDTSTFTAYSAAHVSDDVTPYTAGANINITNHVVSGKDWSSNITSAVSGKLDASTFDTYVTNHASDDVTPYTGGTGISITNHQVSCTGDITPYSAGANVNITNHVVSGKDWSSDIAGAVSGKLDTSTYNSYVTTHSNDDVTPYTGGTGISVSNHQISCTGDITPYTAGSNVTVSNHQISSKDWSSDISTTVNTALTGYQTKLTDITDVQVVTALPASPVANVLYLVKE